MTGISSGFGQSAYGYGAGYGYRAGGYGSSAVAGVRAVGHGTTQGSESASFDGQTAAGGGLTDGGAIGDSGYGSRIGSVYGTYSGKGPDLPTLRQGADPVEMAVRGRIEYLSGAAAGEAAGEVSIAQKAGLAGAESAGEDAVTGEETKSAQEVAEEGECQTCKERKYQDGSDDPGVSFKTPTKVAPEAAAAAVMGHEQEHVTREQAKARAEDREVVSQHVSIHTAVCPECGKVYVSGGTTTTVTAASNDSDSQEAQPLEASAQTEGAEE